MSLLDKKLTRKEFIWSIFSLAVIVSLTGSPKISLGKNREKNSKSGNAYGNNSYGGTKKA